MAMEVDAWIYIPATLNSGKEPTGLEAECAPGLIRRDRDKYIPVPAGNQTWLLDHSTRSRDATLTGRPRLLVEEVIVVNSVHVMMPETTLRELAVGETSGLQRLLADYCRVTFGESKTFHKIKLGSNSFGDLVDMPTIQIWKPYANVLVPVKSEDFTAVTMKNAVCWDINLSSDLTGKTSRLRYTVQPDYAM
jgi:hypothetical protein